MQIHRNRIWNKAAAARLPLILAIAGLLILIVAAFGWYQYVRNKPETVFWEMVENNLQTWSVTRETTQQAGNRQIDQAVQLLIGHQHAAVARTDLVQEGEVSAHVVTESLGTPFEDFIRYIDISTNQPNADGGETDFSDVIGVWARNDQAQSELTDGELYSEMTLGLVPFADLREDARSRILQRMKESNAYRIVGTPQAARQDGRPVYIYQVEVNPEAYIGVLKQLAEEVGLTHLTELNPDNFRNAEAVELSMTADVWSQRLIAVQYADGRAEQYGSYGVRRDVNIPEDAISVQELQQRIQNAQ